MERLPKANVRMLVYHSCQRILDDPVILGLKQVLMGASWQFHDPTRSADAALLFLYQEINSFSFVSRRYCFFSR
jgi:hypothetical protein